MQAISGFLLYQEYDTGMELSDVIDTIEKQQYVLLKILLVHFWDILIIDVLL